MTVLATFTVQWTDPASFDDEITLQTVLSGRSPTTRLDYDGLALVSVGHCLVATGPDDARHRHRHWSAALVVDDLARTERDLRAVGADIVVPAGDGRTGRFLFARHPGGTVVEYLQWTPETLAAVLGYASTDSTR
ncbi:hypothetical protein MPY17_30630 [Rhodococcus opacus]|uniref:VOC family protein n=1 Tax=Rhodococcus opacus TaxID=37919 RepID=UPI001FF1A699|nr:hypothetical protein [Rhodococcus opacus]UOT03260.1 hypothetical protein MPY17_30630 [Rhodococcus opacus]